MMNDKQLEHACWLLLVFKSGLPARTIKTVIEIWCQQDGRSLRDFFAVEAEEWAASCQLSTKMLAKLEQAKTRLSEQIQLVEQLAQKDIHILTILDERYPKLLKAALDHVPPVLCYMGNIGMLERTTIALIGSREASEVSLAFTIEAACYLAEHEANVISGNARGIDRAAFAGATSTPAGHTTLVLPCGINNFSNAQFSELQPQILAGQVLLLSQFHPDAIWFVGRAMERNKVITTLAQVVIVAQSGTTGGTWEGATHALEMKQPVYVCQTHPTPLFEGNTALIKRGARPLYWQCEPRARIDDLLTHVLQESQMLCQQKEAMPPLSQQLSLLLREHGVAYDYH